MLFLFLEAVAVKIVLPQGQFDGWSGAFDQSRDHIQQFVGLFYFP